MRDPSRHGAKGLPVCFNGGETSHGKVSMPQSTPSLPDPPAICGLKHPMAPPPRPPPPVSARSGNSRGWPPSRLINRQSPRYLATATGQALAQLGTGMRSGSVSP
jgi:hypothetical protein